MVLGVASGSRDVQEPVPVYQWLPMESIDNNLSTTAFCLA